MTTPVEKPVQIHEPWSGWLLIGAGVLALAANVGWMDAIPSAMLSVLLLFGGAALTVFGLSVHKRWWALIPASALIGSGLAAVTPEAWSGLALLAALGAGFLGIATRGKDLWWALIPGGTLLGLALVTVDPGEAGAGWLFLGIALGFVLVALGSPQRRWAFIPAAGLLIPWLAVTNSFTPAVAFLWPLALIALGVFFLWRRGSQQ